MPSFRSQWLVTRPVRWKRHNPGQSSRGNGDEQGKRPCDAHWTRLALRQCRGNIRNHCGCPNIADNLILWWKVNRLGMHNFLEVNCVLRIKFSSQSSTLGNSIKTTDGYVLPTLGKEMIHKKPSGPNPIGNQQPPTRP
nr:CLAVATA3/ESR (CLE)-related protein 46 [Ipomoea batatas]